MDDRPSKRAKVLSLAITNEPVRKCPYSGAILPPTVAPPSLAPPSLALPALDSSLASAASSSAASPNLAAFTLFPSTPRSLVPPPADFSSLLVALPTSQPSHALGSARASPSDSPPVAPPSVPLVPLPLPESLTVAAPSRAAPSPPAPQPRVGGLERAAGTGGSAASVAQRSGVPAGNLTRVSAYAGPEEGRSAAEGTQYVISRAAASARAADDEEEDSTGVGGAGVVRAASSAGRDETLQSDRLVLVPFCELGGKWKQTTIDALAMLFHDAEVMTHYDDGVQDAEGARAKATRSYATWYARSVRGAPSWWLMLDRPVYEAGGWMVVGALGFNGEKRVLPQCAVVETAVLLFSEHWRRKLASEAFCTIVKYYVLENKLPYVNGKCGIGATVSPSNVASLGLARNMGLTRREWPFSASPLHAARDWMQLTIRNTDDDAHRHLAFCDAVLAGIARYVHAQLVATPPLTAVIHWRRAERAFYARTPTHIEVVVDAEHAAAAAYGAGAVWMAHAAVGCAALGIGAGTCAWMKQRRTDADLQASVSAELVPVQTGRGTTELRGTVSVIIPRSPTYSLVMSSDEPCEVVVWVTADGATVGRGVAVDDVGLSAAFRRDDGLAGPPPTIAGSRAAQTPTGDATSALVATATIDHAVVGSSKHVVMSVVPAVRGPAFSGGGDALERALAPFNPATTKVVVSGWIVEAAGHQPLGLTCSGEVRPSTAASPASVIPVATLAPGVTTPDALALSIKLRVAAYVSADSFRLKQGYVYVACFDESDPRRGSIFAAKTPLFHIASRSSKDIPPSLRKRKRGSDPDPE